MRLDLFTFAALASLIAIVGLALKPGLERRVIEKQLLDQVEREGFALDSEALTRALIGPGMRMEAFEQNGVQAVQLRAQTALVGDGGGAAVYFGFPPGLTARWRDEEVEVTVRTRSADTLPYETWAARLVVVDHEASPWQRFDSAPDWEDRTLRWRIPREAPNAPLQLALFPAVSGSGKGVDVASISLRRVMPGR